MLLVGAYQGLKYAVFARVRTLLARLDPQAGRAIRYSGMGLSLLPPGVTLRNVRGLPIRHRNLISFESLNVTLPLSSLFRRQRTLEIELLRPDIVLDEESLRRGGVDGGGDARIRIGRVDIRHGRIQVLAGGLSLRLEDFDLRSRPHEGGTRAHLDVPYMRGEIPSGRRRLALEGQMSTDLTLPPEGGLRISRFLWQTRDLRIGLNGLFAAGATTLHAALQGDPVRLLEPELGRLTVTGLVYANLTVRAGRGAETRAHGDFSAPSLVIKGIEHTQVTGTMNWNGRERKVVLHALLNSGSERTNLHIETGGGQTDIRGRDVPGSTLARILEIERDAPLAGMARSGHVHISSAEIAGEADLSAAGSAASPFALDGHFSFRRDKKRKETSFAVHNGALPAGRVTLKGMSRTLDRRLDLDVQADFRDLQHLDPLARHYLGLPLSPWRLQGGGGSLQLQLRKRAGHGVIRARVGLHDFRSRGLDIDRLEGDVVSTPPRTSGDFSIRATALQARAALQIGPGSLDISFLGVDAQAAAIARLLDRELLADGRIHGDFRYRQRKREPAPALTGTLRADELRVAGLPLRDVRSRLETNLHAVRLPDLTFRLNGGRARAAIDIDFAARRFDIDGRLQDMALEGAQHALAGRLDLEVAGRGEFLRDPLTFSYRLANGRYYADREFQVAGRGELRSDFRDLALQTRGTLSNPSGDSPFGLEFRRRAGQYSGSFNLHLRDLNLLVPWAGNSGELQLLGDIDGAALDGLECRGVAMVSGRTLVLPSFPHSLNHFQGNITFRNLAFRLQSLRGELGGGRAEFNGHVSAGRGGLRELELNLNGQEMTLFPMDRVSLRLNAGLTLAYRDRRLLLSGAMHVLGAEWERQIDEPLTFSTRSQLSAAESRIRETLQLDIRLTGNENIWMNNAFGRIAAKFSLHLRGSVRYPQIIGSIEGTGGTVNFSERKFGLVRGRITFSDRFTVDPQVQIESETFVQNYRISMFIRGTLSRPKPELVSSPPLPPQDILALVSLGEIFKRPGSEEVSSQLGSTALLSTELTREIKNRANKLLGIDLLRLDPLMSGSSGTSTSRLTVGKSLSKNLIVVYSTNLATYRQEIYYLQYQLSPTLSLIAMRNEEGNYAFDIRFRRRK